MMSKEPFQSLEEEVASTFVERLHGKWTPADEEALEQRLTSDPAYAEAYRLAQDALDDLRAHADLPAMIRIREQALARARPSARKRWLTWSHRRQWRWVAAIASLTVGLAMTWQLSPLGYRPGQYRTGIGEQRIVELDDHSRIAMDAATRLSLRYTAESRTIRLIDGQAQFWVAKDPLRPFKVIAGDRTIIAVGTVFTVEYMDQQIHVAMVEGRVLIVPEDQQPRLPAPNVLPQPSAPSRADSGQGKEVLDDIDLSAGEELSVSRDGRATLIPKADIEAATAWRRGQVIFRAERLGDAIESMNRYSRIQLKITDPALANERVSGVFDTGDTQGFIKGVELALPFVVSEREGDSIRLSER